MTFGGTISRIIYKKKQLVRDLTAPKNVKYRKLIVIQLRPKKLAKEIEKPTKKKQQNQFFVI